MTALQGGTRPRGDRGIAGSLAALQAVLEAGGDQLEPDAVDAAVSAIDRAHERLGSAPGATVVALAGATGSGKSSLFNTIAGLPVAQVGHRRPTTASPTACVWGDVPDALLDWLEVPRRHRTERVSELDADHEEQLSGLVLLDLPDHDSTEVSHRLQVDRLVGMVDLLVWVVDPQKYADAALHAGYLRSLSDHSGVVLVVLNQVDTLEPAAAAACEADLRRLLADDGLDGVRVLATSARTGQGSGELRAVLTELVRRRTLAEARTEADVRAALRRLAPSVAGAEPDPASVEGAGELVDALAVAAGVPAITDAVRASVVREGRRRTGWPYTRWLARLRPDPLARLHLSGRRAAVDAPGEELARLTRSSVPPPTPSQRAQVATAAREVAGAAAAQLPRRWADAVRASAAPSGEDLADALDQAVQQVPLGVRHPGWWSAVGALQVLLALVAAVGALWLLALAAVAWLQLPDPPLPRVGHGGWAVPLPTLLLVVGVVAGLVVAALSGVAVRRRAERVRRRLREQLREAVAVVARERLLDAVAAVLERHRATREALALARSLA